MNRRIAAVVVAFHSRTELPACLAALRAHVARAVVVCNDAGESADADLRQRHAWVTWIDNPVNVGFAAAVNQGLAATRANHVLLLNPDCEVLSDLAPMIAACEIPGVAGAGGLLVDRAGSPQTGFFARSLPSAWALACESLGINRLWRRNPVNRRYRLLDLDPEVACEVGQPAAAFLMLRRDAWDTVAGMDERFHPVWWEDVDLCRRLADAGFSLRYVPGAVARHVGGHSVQSLSVQRRLQAWYGGMLRYSEKHHSPGAYRRVRVAVLVGLTLRGLLSWLAMPPEAEWQAYRATLRAVRHARPD